MSFLPSISSQYVFNLPSDFVPKEINDLFMPLIELHHSVYDDVISYLNSTILKVDYPGMSMDIPYQTTYQGKQINYREARPLQDLLNNRQITVVFAKMNGDFNYWILSHLFKYHYLNNNNNFINPFLMSVLDLNRDEIFTIQFKQLIFKELSDIEFNYGDFDFKDETFTVVFNFNFHDIIYKLKEDKVLISENDIFKIINNNNI